MVAESVVMAMGGFCSLLHYNLAHSYETDIAKHLGDVMRKVMLALGFTEEGVRKRSVERSWIRPRSRKYCKSSNR